MGICSFVVLWEVSHVVFGPCGTWLHPTPHSDATSLLMRLLTGHEVSHGDDVDHVKMIQRCKRGGMTPMMPSVGEFEGKLLCRLGDQGTKEGSQ